LETLPGRKTGERQTTEGSRAADRVIGRRCGGCTRGRPRPRNTHALIGKTKSRSRVRKSRSIGIIKWFVNNLGRGLIRGRGQHESRSGDELLLHLSFLPK